MMLDISQSATLRAAIEVKITDFQSDSPAGDQGLRALKHPF